MRRTDVASILKLAERPDVLSFAGGLPAPESFLIEDFAELDAAVLRDHGRAALGYSPSAGISALRETLATRMEQFGRPTHPDEVLVTTGGIAALDLIAKAYLDPGDVVLVGAPSYLAALHVLRSYEARIVGVALDDQGLIPDALEATLAELAREGRMPKFIYLVPTFQNPTGITLPASRRRRVVELARDHVWSKTARTKTCASKGRHRPGFVASTRKT
jgi:2-aminoadipate transaminase